MRKALLVKDVCKKIIKLQGRQHALLFQDWEEMNGGRTIKFTKDDWLEIRGFTELEIFTPDDAETAIMICDGVDFGKYHTGKAAMITKEGCARLSKILVRNGTGSLLSALAFERGTRISEAFKQKLAEPAHSVYGAGLFQIQQLTVLASIAFSVAHNSTESSRNCG